MLPDLQSFEIGVVGTVVNGNEIYLYCNPGEKLCSTALTTGATAPFPTPRPIRSYDAL